MWLCPLQCPTFCVMGIEIVLKYSVACYLRSVHSETKDSMAIAMQDWDFGAIRLMWITVGI